MLTTSTPTSSAEIGDRRRGATTSVPNIEGNCCGRGAELDADVLADDQAEPDRGDHQRDVVAAGRQQAVDEGDLEHPAEQQDGDRDRDREARR